MEKPVNLVMRLENLPVAKWHLIMAMVLCFTILFDAYDSTILSVGLPQIMEQWQLNKVQAGILGSAGFVGMLIGALLSGIMADRFGRLRVIYTTILIYSILTGVAVFSKNFEQLYFLRICIGIGLGGLIPVGSTYMAEYVPAKVRGRFVSIFNACFSLGVALAYTLGFLIVVPYGWRWGFAIGVLPFLMYFVAKASLPESVRYLLEKGKIEEAVRTVEKIEKRVLNKVTVPFEEAVRIEKEIAGTHRSGTRIGVTDLFTRGMARYTIVVAIAWFSLQYCVYAIMVWMPVVLRTELGFKLATGLSFLALGSLLGALATPLSGVSADSIGRKISLCCIFVLYGILPYFLFLFGKDPLTGFILLMATLIVVGLINGIVYVYSPENFPTKARGARMGFVTAVGRVGAIAGPTIVGFIYSVAGFVWVLHVNMALLVFAALVVWAFGRETKGKVLEEIEA
ncbi:MAG TPA: MFS transporter [Bacillota bacterium]|nr:MFS transporter [Bacillota bacterium]